MESILEKLRIYRKEDEKEKIDSLFELKEIYDSYLANHMAGLPVPAWS
jgi:hypothetical protein